MTCCYCFVIVYIIPPVINFVGKRFAVAQLIKWGYASLVSTGVPPGPGVNVAPLVQPGGGLFNDVFIIILFLFFMF